MQQQEFDKFTRSGSVEEAINALHFSGENPTLQEVKEKEEPIPEELKSKIIKFAQEQKRKGASERSIKRSIKRKFHIVIIEK